MSQLYAREFLEIIQKESERLHFLIDDLLEFSGIEREGFSLHSNFVNVKEIIEDALKVVSGKLEQKNMNINRRCSRRISLSKRIGATDSSNGQSVVQCHQLFKG